MYIYINRHTVPFKLTQCHVSYISVKLEKNQAASELCLVLGMVAVDLIKGAVGPHEARPGSEAAGGEGHFRWHLSPEVTNDDFHNFVTLGCHPNKS